MINPYYVSGFADGEGSFSITVSPRGSLKTGWEIRPSFSVSQNKDSRGVLFELKGFFRCGFVRPSRSDNTFKYEVRSLQELTDRVIPHFEKYPLRTAKKNNFEIFKSVVLLMTQGRHLEKDGLKEIVGLLEKLNASCKKIYARGELKKLMNV